MPVFEKAKKWPAPIFYEWKSESIPTGESAIKKLNEAAGWDLLQPRDKSSSVNSYLVLEVFSMVGGANSPIGMEAKQPQSIGLQPSERVNLHELMHALGFHHEEKHEHFPWGTSGRKDGKLGTDATNWEKALQKKLGEHYGTTPKSHSAKSRDPLELQDEPLIRKNTAKKPRPPVRERSSSNVVAPSKTSAMAVESTSSRAPQSNLSVEQKILDFRKASQLDGTLLSLFDCDMGSIMMYPCIREAVEAIQGEEPSPNAYKGGTKDANETLSQLDTKALQMMYPKPQK